MSTIEEYLFPAMWLGYLAYWQAMSKGVKVTERKEPGMARLVRLVSIVCAVGLLSLPRIPLLVLHRRFLPVGDWWFWSGAVVTASGLLCSVWARHHLGKNWSQAVTLKAGHELITTGPYAVVRHPIYTGLLMAFAGSAIARGEWRGVLAVALVLTVLWRKLRLEEEWMRSRFGDAYETYARRVSRLVPYVL
jgi:protein-S-isoprenylcysteine O-methyltransferase Ste14